jgi:hypothetical protein
VDGLEEHLIAFAVLDDTDKETVHQTSTTKSSTAYFFQPTEGHQYRLLIISRDEFLYKNFRVSAFAGDILNNDDEESNAPESKRGTAYDKDTFRHSF